MTQIVKNNKDNYLLFEYFCTKKHQLDFNQITYHWSNIPDSVLIESNFISSYEELRNKRKNNCNLREYGLDAISV